jgi:hypothetical protein
MTTMTATQIRSEAGFWPRRAVCDLAGGQSPPTRVVVIPWGDVQGNDRFTINDDGAASIVAAFRRRGVDLPIDIEHQTMGGSYTSPDGSAPAVGWIKALRAEHGVGIVADVSWTAHGEKMIGSRAYRYLSPVVLLDGRTNVARELHSVALTNKPAIVGMPAVVNSAGLSVAGDGPAGRFRTAVARRMQSGMSRRDAALSALKDDPRMHNEFVAGYNKAAAADHVTVRLGYSAAKARWDDAIHEKQQRGMSRRDATLAVNRGRPELRESYVAAFNEHVVWVNKARSAGSNLRTFAAAARV